jgi:hypothetical protein
MEYRAEMEDNLRGTEDDGIYPIEDLIKLRARKGQSVKGSSISMVLNRWRSNRKIEKIGEAKYKKL